MWVCVCVYVSVCARLCVCTLVPFERDLSVNKMTGSLFFSTSFGLVQLCGSRVNELCWVELASPWQVGVPAEMPCIISACLLWSSQAHCWFIDNLHKGTWFRAVVHPVTHRGQCGTASPCHSILFFFYRTTDTVSMNHHAYTLKHTSYTNISTS